MNRLLQDLLHATPTGAARRWFVAALLAMAVAGSIGATARHHPPVVIPPAVVTAAPVTEEPEAVLASAMLPADVVRPTFAPPVRAPRVIEMEVTAYCACKACCGPKAQGLTASGLRVSHNGGLFVAADTSLFPFGTKLKIPGYAAGAAVEVIDRGGAIKGHKLDVYFPTHEQAKQWGRRKLLVTVLD